MTKQQRMLYAVTTGMALVGGSCAGELLQKGSVIHAILLMATTLCLVGVVVMQRY